MRNFLLGIVVTVAFFAIGAAAYLRFGWANVQADVPPSRWEQYWMTSAVHASVRRKAPEVGNPFPLTDEMLIDGAHLYASQCALCHGSPGSARPSGGPAPLYPDPPHLPSAGTQYTEAQVYWIAKHGIRRTGMLASGAWNSDRRLWGVAAYIKRMNALPQSVQDKLAKK